MSKPLFKQYRTRRGERGVGLLFAFFAIVFISGYILVNINVDRNRILRERVAQTAWLVNELTQAARLYVRDQNTSGTGAFQKSALCTTPRNITVAELVTNGYIGANVGRKNAGNTNFVTPLDQTVYLVAANSVINSGACTAPDLEDVAATAYLVMRPPVGIDPAALPFLTEALGNEGLSVSPPIFDAAGTNMSPACNGTPATIQWDTGCLNGAQFSFLLPAIPFANNMIGLPVWLSARGDTRAVFRYEQAENPQAQRMQTDLRMAPMANIDTTTCTQVNVRSATTGSDPAASTLVPSGVCAVIDDSGGTNNRRDINNASSIDVARSIITPQGTDVGGADAGTDLAVTGVATVTGNVRSFATTNSITANNSIVLAGGASSLAVVGRPGSSAPRMMFNNVQAGNLQAIDANIANDTVVTTNSAIGNNLQINGNATVIDTGNAGRGVIINRLNGTAVNLTVAGEAAIGGSTYVTGATNVTGAGSGLSMATARLDAANANVSGNVVVNNDLSSDKATTITSIQSTSASVNECKGDCPDRQPDPPPPL